MSRIGTSASTAKVFWFPRPEVSAEGCVSRGAWQQRGAITIPLSLDVVQPMDSLPLRSCENRKEITRTTVLFYDLNGILISVMQRSCGLIHSIFSFMLTPPSPPDAFNSSDIEIAGGTFTECESLFDGGFLFASDGAKVKITGGNIVNNRAAAWGAGVSQTLLLYQPLN